MRVGIVIFGLILILIGVSGQLGVISLDILDSIILIVIVFGFIIFIVGLAIPKAMRKPEIIELSTDSQNMRSCPSCGRLIPSDADICPHGGRKLTIFENSYGPSE